MRTMRCNIPLISVDYMWMKGKKGDVEEEAKGNPILVMHCRETKVTWSRVVLKKGVDPYSIKVLSDMILFTGHKRVILKSDGESSIKALKDAVKNSSEFNMGVEVSPVGDSKANGEVERAIKTVQGQVRTLKSALDEHYKTNFNENHVLLPWLISYAASLISKFTIGADGKTAHERARGRKFNRALPEFGECILYAKYLPKKGYDKLEPQWGNGSIWALTIAARSLS